MKNKSGPLSKKKKMLRGKQGHKRVLDLMQQKEFAQALELAEKCIGKKSKDAHALNTYAILLARHKRYDEAIRIWRNVIKKTPNNPDVLANLGLAHRHCGQLEPAKKYLQKALRLKPAHANALLNMGFVLSGLKEYDNAMSYYQRSLKINPNNLQALFNIGFLKQRVFQFDEAHDIYTQIIAADPTYTDAYANLIFTRHYLALPQPEQISIKARDLGKRLCAKHSQYTTWSVDKDPAKRLRIGLVSADLKDHPVGYFIEGLLRDDASRDVDWFAYYNYQQETDLTARIKPLFASWLDISTYADPSAAAQIHQDGIDILIDLSGYTAGHRIGMFALKPAPVQVSWLGYFGTTGLPTMDAVIADPVCVPESETSLFSEKIYHMPASRFCFTPPDNAPDISPLPSIEKGFCTFGNFQELAKINDEVLKLWKQIADAVPDSRFRIQSKRLIPESRDLLDFTARLERCGFDMARVCLHGSTPRHEYLACHAEIDLVLDTFPYPGGTTTAEAIWMGVPTISLATPGMLGRQGQGILHACNQAEWAVQTKKEYIEKAVHWSSKAQQTQLAGLRVNCRQAIEKSALFDASRFATDWHKVIRTIWQEIGCG